MASINLEEVKVILATDCGSTTSKARLFRKLGDTYRFITAGEAPTTVEAPYEDVTFGVHNAIKEIEELTGHKILGKEGILKTIKENEGVDLYVTTSSAGGGLQMMCTGVIRNMTAESAERAALGAGAIVMDVIALDDGREVYEKINRIRALRPDMILMAGGTDGGTVSHLVEMAEMIYAASPKARFGMSYKLPVIYAGNKNAKDQVKTTLGGDFALEVVDNIRPMMDIENTEPAREAVHECFMEHVMSHAPGYDKLMKWTPVPIMPTPAGEGTMFQTIARMRGINVIGVGLGGATTNIYSVFDGRFVRTVSANLGMSYSIGNVVREAGLGNIMRWIPFEISEVEMRQEIYNKMIRPTIIPQTLKTLLIEHAVAREALRMGFQHHKSLARPLRGVKVDVQIDSIHDQKIIETYIDLMKLNWLGGTGGLLSHVPRWAQSMLVLIDGFQPEGVTRMGQDSVFMMPHLGVLSTVHPKAAMDVFEKDCLVRLGTCIAPVGLPKRSGEGEKMATVTMKMPNGESVTEEMYFGTMKRIPLSMGEIISVEIRPESSFDVGRGKGNRLETEVEGGAVGIVLDARGRPIAMPSDDEKRRGLLVDWFNALDAYPKIPS